MDNGQWVNVAKEGRLNALNAGTGADDLRVLGKTSGRSTSIRTPARDNAELWALRYKPIESRGSWHPAGEGAPGTPGSVPTVYLPATRTKTTITAITTMATMITTIILTTREC